MAKMTPKMKKAYAAYEKAEPTKVKMNEAKMGMKKKTAKKAAKKKMVK